ncbi:hypothetical protein AFE_2452 [Acidithiobacillus ferrooxidans ATCC 23270]|uniref:Uncharacterized protein n=1 Tax=Acidithiobacillus ferrooxidans (strain ATCC 23270 / DSM 14882 / CIP 104768 / NCIMB 8455) TaxID=243159 RepID=B7J6Y9_ACIF2|nr:hypothetical protein AFE_2452 [Acidithiobacillus ferrooxidans ATCC 23270]
MVASRGIPGYAGGAARRDTLGLGITHHATSGAGSVMGRLQFSKTILKD